MSDVQDLRYTIIPKSDQLNSEQLMTGSMVITVADVRAGGGADQPLSIHYDNDGGRPYKPCKTMRKVLIFAWGSNGYAWIGRSMELYNDPSVRFGGAEVGGIRISRMTDIPDKGFRMSLTATKGKKAPHEIKLLRIEPELVETPIPSDTPDAHTSAIHNAATMDDLAVAFKAAQAEARTARDAQRLAQYVAAKDARKVVLESAPTGESHD